MNQLEQKYQQLKTVLQEMGSVVIGYSGGVDSTFLAKVATDVLGDKALSVAAISPSYPKHEHDEAKQFAVDLGLNFDTVSTTEMDNPDYRKNAPDRCYHCKKELVVLLKNIARDRGFNVVALGANFDDLGDYRPGQKAAKEEGIRNPMMDLEITKDDIRALSKQLNIPTWDKPSFACLSSRIPYGIEITPEKLSMVDKAEQIMREYNFGQFRVRHHNDVARIELLPEDMSKLLHIREEIAQRLKGIGYAYIAMDLLGYRTGSMNEVLHKIDSQTIVVK